MTVGNAKFMFKNLNAPKTVENCSKLHACHRENENLLILSYYTRPFKMHCRMQCYKPTACLALLSQLTLITDTMHDASRVAALNSAHHYTLALLKLKFFFLDFEGMLRLRAMRDVFSDRPAARHRCEC